MQQARQDKDGKDPVAEWYERRRQAALEAWEKVRQARERGASYREIHRLTEAAIDAGDCGD